MIKKDESGIKLKDVKCYNSKFHDKHSVGWTTNEVEYITTTKDTLVVMSLTLGRTAGAVCQMRGKLRKIGG
ncbi:hypothetical protein H3N56_10335 [Cetobacterium sp. 2A]|uniref:hypothetical protein n=1 Tax=Cetobacterium sp. 2A TaxID=2754723 RepID=UPI00163BF9DC|nr:hypothetical protein [Cetobacterium sp. 2A]MBC2856797.1 hypothetical protein [Cetobacterium sp. 2A]MBC2856838.1 hypothetical protein [Cetobacterium sp. 2A]